MKLSFFSDKWKQAQNWIFHAIKYSVISKKETKQFTYKMLCVDDDRSFCQFMVRLADSLGIQLDEAYSVDEAKQAIETYPNYQAYIIDGHLPDGSGFEIVAWIREKKELKTPIGFISRFYQDSKSFRILKEGLAVDYVLEKPISPSEVHQLLIKLCQINEPSFQEPFSDDLLADLKGSYQKTISDKIERLEKMILDIEKDPSIPNLQTLRTEVHKIAGSAGSYGYAAVSEICKNLETDLIKQIDLAHRGQLNYQWLFSLDDFFTQIKLHFQIELLEPDTQGSYRAHYLSSVYIVDEDQTFLNLFTQPDSDPHFDILTEMRPEKAISTLSSADIFPQILLLNAHYSSSVFTGYEFIKAFYKKNDYLTTTIALMVNHQDLEDQIEALKRGMLFILAKPFSVPLLLPFLNLVPFRPLPLHYKILVIDDDLDICHYIFKTLKFKDLEIQTLQNLHDLESTLSNYKPDLILLDINLTDESGIDLLAKIRQQFGYKKQLVGMLALTQHETSLIQKCYDANVDEILFKPLEGGILQRKIAYLLKRQTEKMLAPKQEATTGLETVQTLKRYIHEMSQISLPGMLVIFELENFASISQKIKKEVLRTITQDLDELLQKYEIAAYLGDGRFALVFQAYDPNFVQLFMHAFLLQVYFRLKTTLLKNKEFYLNEALVVVSTSSQKGSENILQQGKELLRLARQEQPKQPVCMKTSQLIDDLKEVLILHDSAQSFDEIKTLFEKHAFKVSLLSTFEEVETQSIHLKPYLILLAGSWASAKGLHELMQFPLLRTIQFPFLFLSHSPKKKDLQTLLSAVNYFEAPFRMAILIASASENQKN
jgi:DNA-binding response OmpR family regulator